MKWASANELLTFVQQEQLVAGSADPSLFDVVRQRSATPRDAAIALQRLEALSEYQTKMLLSGSKADLVFGPYRLLERLGVNAISRVFRARDTRTNQQVALKILTELAQNSEETQRRFRREIRATRTLNHPNIVRTLDAQLTDTVGYLAMEFLAGADLQKIVDKHGKLPVAKACPIAGQAALGLQHAHESGLIHRDIKPGNLMICEQSVKILDFGLVRQHAGLSNDSFVGGGTFVGGLLGTADYMSPEQAIDARMVDIRTDIYGLGCTLFTVLAGEPPFHGGSAMQKLYRHQKETPRRLDALRPEVSPALAEVVAKMLRKDRDERYATPGEVAKALEPFC